MSIIQDEFDRASGSLTLNPGEYEGPLRVDRPCVIDGQHSTIWANRGPVLIVDSESVVLKNLRVEVVGNPSDEEAKVSLRLNRADTRLENIEVNGVAQGLPGESSDWTLPGVIALGDFAANKENIFTVELNMPGSAVLEHDLKDVSIRPERVRRGHNTLEIRTSNMRDNTILFGELLIKTSVAHRIYITGKASKNAPVHQADPPVSGRLTISEPLQIDLREELDAPEAADSSPGKTVNRGQRLPLNGLENKPLKIVYSHRGTRRSLDVDPYVFFLGKNGKVRSDGDLFFFGNPKSGDGSVRVGTESGAAQAVVDLSKIPDWAEKAAVCLSVYDDQSGSAFADVEEPEVRVLSAGKEQFRFALEGLSTEKTVVAVELYRYKGSWKISFVGGGFAQGLDALCRQFGVEVE